MTVPSLDGAPIEITQSSTSYSPAVLGLPGGGFAVLYQTAFDAATDPDGGAGAAVRIYDADGQPAGPAFHVALDTTGSHLPQEIIATPTGFAVLWLASPLVGSPQVPMLQRFDADGTRDGDAVELGYSDFGGVIGLSAAPTGEIVVIHSDFTDDSTRVSVVETNGTLSKDYEDEGMGRNSLVGGAWQATTASNGDILFLRDTVGSRLPDMSWSRDLTLHRLDADGNLLSSTVIVDDLPNPGSFLFAATADGGAVVVEVVRTGETSELSIWKVDADGTVAAPLVSTVDETLEARSISPTADGGFLVVYLGGDYADPAGYEVMAQKFDADCLSEGDPFVVNQDPDGHQGRADVALLTDDDLIVAYESGPDYEILAQRLDPSGTTTGVVLDDPVIADYGNGKDREHGGNNDDVMRGGNGKDKLWGHEGDDSLFGNNGKDDLYGGDDDDVLRGGRGKDELFGGDGDDLLDGGSGKDWAMGGEGSDTFLVEKKTKLAVADFQHGVDQVWLTWGASEFDDLKFKEKKGDVVLKLKAGTTVVFEDVKDADAFDHHDFLFG